MASSYCRYSIDQRIKIVWFYAETKSIKLTQKKYREHFKVKRAPAKPTIRKLKDKFLMSGSVHDLVRHGRIKTGRSTDNIDIIRQAVAKSPKRSVRRLSAENRVPRSSVHRILRRDLKKYPYKIQIKQKIKTADRRARQEFCNWISKEIDQKSSFLNNIWFSDEAHFHLSGHVNKQNMRFWGTQNPHEIEEKPLHVEKCTAWCAISTHGIIGPYWFEEPESGSALTVNQERYRHVLTKFWTALLRRVETERRRRNQWFQQDGATPHTAKQTLEWLKQRFHGKIISLKTDKPWPPHSPDLSPPDFFLWGYLKDRVYSTKPRSIAELKRNIRNEIKKIDQDTCKKVIQNFAVRVRECGKLHGGHLEHILNG
jgi:hypothetical protein